MLELSSPISLSQGPNTLVEEDNDDEVISGENWPGNIDEGVVIGDMIASGDSLRTDEKDDFAERRSSLFAVVRRPLERLLSV